MHADEAALLAAILQRPADSDAWLVLADWLDDHADPRGEAVRLCHALRQSADVPDRTEKEARVAALLAAGIRPPVPSFVTPLGLRMILVPPGTFTMGSPHDLEGIDPDEKAHAVRLTRPFFLADRPVTQGLYTAVMDANPSSFAPGGERHAALPAGTDVDLLPADSVTWDEAVEFCKRLTAREPGRQYRLPTEAEWEYAARGAGTCSRAHVTGDTITPEQACFGRGHLLPTGSFAPNLLGLYDLAGGVWEWCSDWYGVRYYAKSPAEDPPGPKRGRYRVLRGGSWNNTASGLRVAFRVRNVPASRNQNYGFRVALSVD